MPITWVGSQKNAVWTELETKAGVKGDVSGLKQNTDWQWDVWAPEQHTTTFSPLQQTVACVKGTLVRDTGCNWRNLLFWPVAAEADTCFKV